MCGLATPQLSLLISLGVIVFLNLASLVDPVDAAPMMKGAEIEEIYMRTCDYDLDEQEEMSYENEPSRWDCHCDPADFVISGGARSNHKNIYLSSSIVSLTENAFGTRFRYFGFDADEEIDEAHIGKFVSVICARLEEIDE